MKRNINGGMYEDMDRIRDELERLKGKLIELGPKFGGKMEIFAEIQVSIIAKAADYLTIASR